MCAPDVVPVSAVMPTWSAKRKITCGTVLPVLDAISCTRRCRSTSRLAVSSEKPCQKVSLPKAAGFPITSRSMYWMNRGAVVRRCCHSAVDDDETKVSYAASRG